MSRGIGTLPQRKSSTVWNWGRSLTVAVRLLLAPAAIAVLASAVGAEEGTKASAPPIARFTAKVKDMHAAGESLAIPLNRSVLIETSQAVATVQSISPEIAIVQSISPTQFLISGASYGETQVVAWSADGSQHIFNVTVELDLQALLDALKRIDPRSDVRATPIRGNIILTGQVTSAAAAQKMLEVAMLFMPQGEASVGGMVQNHLQITGEPQVLLRCTVAEVNRRAVRELGINGFLGGEDFRDMFAVNQIGGINPINIGAAADASMLGPIPFLTGENGIPLEAATTLSVGFPRAGMQFFLRAMAENALMRVLAEPNLVAVSGETATFLAGGEFPYPVPQGGQSNSITIEFREFGVRLNFTPVVLANQTIRLRVEPEVSALDYSNAVQVQGTLVPGLTQRKTQTTVEIGNGQTLAIAGLLNEEVRGVARRIPGIGDVPVLGALFRSVEYRKNLTELVVLVTPEIVAPMNPEQVPPVPGQFVRDPNDWQLYLLGLVEGEPFVDASTPADALQTRPHRATDLTARGAPSAARLTESDRLSLHGPWGASTYEDVH
ncbi:MAG: type II and III secretion system protein family protein [Planctomycetota bacterium]